MKVTTGKDSISITRVTWWGLGAEKMVAIYYPNLRTLVVMDGEENPLGIILKALRKTGQINEPIMIKYW